VTGALSAAASVGFALLAALAPTLAVELPVAALLGLRSTRALAAVAAVNLLTNPTLNLILLALFGGTGLGAASAAFWPTLAALEVAAVIVEWRLLLWVLGGSPRRLLLVCAALNASSFAVGLAAAALR
jgi:hypothetical protein